MSAGVVFDAKIVVYRTGRPSERVIIGAYHGEKP
jgi:hypothetical protein